MPSPAFEKDNAMTQMIRRAQRINAESGMPAGRSLTDQPVTVGQGTTVRSAAMNNPTPLSPEEVAARDARARELGILPPTPDEDGPYGSLAEAQAAGMPDQPRPTQAELDAHNGADFGLLAPQRVVRLSAPPSQPPATGPMVKLPDFRKVEGFDFFRNVLYIDGLEFAIPEADVRGMKQYAVDLALDHVVKQLAAALVEFGVPPELANQTADSVRGSVHETSTGPGEGTSSDAGAERQPDGGDQAAEGSPRAE